MFVFNMLSCFLRLSLLFGVGSVGTTDPGSTVDGLNPLEIYKWFLATMQEIRDELCPDCIEFLTNPETYKIKPNTLFGNTVAHVRAVCIGIFLGSHLHRVVRM